MASPKTRGNARPNAPEKDRTIRPQAFGILFSHYASVYRPRIGHGQSDIGMSPPAEIRRKLTIVVPAYNEQARLPTTVKEVMEVAASLLDEFEVILVDDGSTDATGEIADRLAGAVPGVTVVHHGRNIGVGKAFENGVGRARYPWITLVPGDNAFHRDALKAVFAAVGKADLVISYRSNLEERSLIRRVMSWTCTALVRVITKANIRDAHSLYVFPVSVVREIGPLPVDNRYHLATLTYLLGRCKTFVQVPARLTPRPDASSRVKLKMTIFKTWLVLTMLWHSWRKHSVRKGNVARELGLDLPPPAAAAGSVPVARNSRE
ncbi:MAG: glycosyltransferase family 2 protein [Pseudorhodoplanes sp.]|nr:glycosyltransferase family 2 protein [Pseudorhodoplanes sp.]